MRHRAVSCPNGSRSSPVNIAPQAPCPSLAFASINSRPVSKMEATCWRHAAAIRTCKWMSACRLRFANGFRHGGFPFRRAGAITQNARCSDRVIWKNVRPCLGVLDAVASDAIEVKVLSRPSARRSILIERALTMLTVRATHTAYRENSVDFASSTVPASVAAS